MVIQVQEKPVNQNLANCHLNAGTNVLSEEGGYCHVHQELFAFLRSILGGPASENEQLMHYVTEAWYADNFQHSLLSFRTLVAVGAGH